MEFPLDKETMRSFLGMVNYLNWYSAHLCALLSALTHQAIDYKPSKEHFENFNRLKVEVSNMGNLPYFDVNAETTLQMDTSKKGLVACIIQKGKVVCYVFRSLTNLSRNIKIWKGSHWEPYGEWKISITSCMERNSHWKLTRSHLIDKKHMIDIGPRVQRHIVRSFPYLPFKVVYKKE